MSHALEIIYRLLCPKLNIRFDNKLLKKKGHKVLSLCFHTAPCTSHQLSHMLSISRHVTNQFACILYHLTYRSYTTLLPAVANTVLLRLPHKYKSNSFKSGDMVGQASSLPYTLNIFMKTFQNGC
jgi:hypothetical protein